MKVSDMSDLRRDEYTALRATIRERGTVRVITFLVTIVAWATLELVYSGSGPTNIVGSLLSLTVLAAGFEVIYQLHLGVERVGRYLQVEYEEPSAGGVEAPAPAGRPAWETTAMAYGRNHATAGSDALFSGMFVLATVLNLLPVLEAWRVPAAFISLTVAHLVFLVRVRLARAYAGVQRAQDLARFREIKATTRDGGASASGDPQAEGA
jgi:4-hydroxybenzoate polyprenyltransferase